MGGIQNGKNCMGKKYNLFDVLQNPTIGAIAIHSFILGFQKIMINKSGDDIYPPIEYVFYVLPIIYSRKSLLSLKSSNQLYTALSKDKTLSVGLQDKANKMSSQTFESLNLGFSKKIFFLDTHTFKVGTEIGSNLVTKMNIKDQEIKDIRKAASQLGNIFAKKDKKMLQITLDIRF